MKELNFNGKINDKQYSNTFTSLVWVLFINAKADIHNDEKDMVKMTCLLATVFYTMIRYCLEYTKPLFLSDVSSSRVLII